ncbi:MAG: mechanosensitive ion channel family protein [Pseudomonadales bacterium]
MKQDYWSAMLTWVSDPEVMQVFGIVLATGIIHFVASRLVHRLERRAAGTNTTWDDALVATIKRPLSLIIWVLGISFAAQVAASQMETGFGDIIEPMTHVAVAIVVTLFLIRFIKEAEKGMVAKGADMTTANAIARLLQVSVAITALLTVLQTLGVSISGVLAFGGIGGIAIGFAARDLLANFFGSVMIYLDRPFVLGEWIRSPDRDIEGTVENIGWRLTQIRTFDQRPVYVPNAIFTNIAVENPSRMHNRRIYETIGVRYDDAGKVRAIVDDVSEMLKNHPDIEQNRTLMVNFNAFAASSLDFFIYAFTKTTVWTEYHGVKQNVLLAVLDIIDSHGAEVAFPTSTIHISPAEPEPE